MTEVLSVREAADLLGVSPQRVRQLIKDGRLSARRSTGGWLVPEAAVRRRLGDVAIGRPAESTTVWAVIRVLVEARLEVSDGVASQVPRVLSDRRSRHRVLRLMARLPDPVADPAPWMRLLSGRGGARRVWAHPGALGRLAAERRVSVGGDPAAAIAGVNLIGGPPVRFLYVRPGDVDGLVHDYRLRDHDEGNIVLIVVPDDVRAALGPTPGEPVPGPAAAGDLIEEDDPRARDAGLHLLREFWQAVYRRGWLDGARDRFEKVAP